MPDRFVGERLATAVSPDLQKREYAKFYPDGRLNQLRTVCNALTIVAAIVFLWKIGFFR